MGSDEFPEQRIVIEMVNAATTDEDTKETKSLGRRRTHTRPRGMSCSWGAVLEGVFTCSLKSREREIKRSKVKGGRAAVFYTAESVL